jgi:hypothetical protein
MTNLVGRLGDRLVERLIPKARADASQYTVQNYCGCFQVPTWVCRSGWGSFWDDCPTCPCYMTRCNCP